jgi:hypothetical protein
MEFVWMKRNKTSLFRKNEGPDDKNVEQRWKWGNAKD